MRLKLKRVASTLLFGLFCSVITALHLSSKSPQNGEASQIHNNGGVPRPRGANDQKVARNSQLILPVAVEEGHGETPGRKDTHGFRLQREMAWAADDPPAENIQQPNVSKSFARTSNNSATFHNPATEKTTHNKTQFVITTSGRKINHQKTISEGRSFAEIDISDIFIGIKTTSSFHKNRVQLILDTWLPLAKEQTYFFTDKEDRHYRQLLGDHLINTNCSSQHSRNALCCKVASMYDTFLKSGKRWFCHLDDDNYLNVRNLVLLLQGYDYHQDYYLGRASLNHAIQALDRDRGYMQISFWFATGGAGFCISESLALKMAPMASGGKFMNLCNRVRLPDDVSIGFLVDGLLKVPLTRVGVFNSHLQGLGGMEEQRLLSQVTLSYLISPSRNNTITLKNAAFSTQDDPTRLRSLHCKLYPQSSKC
ncbi:beta-1,3-N-acetylglucosaminyltransferase radical fringe-like isoform X2 [Asterias amurensis]|uniref:beta-1,3-N-acetylglucosaminyltransferase radical fringe-like isoform X2 n=1 Tax=Asterias amurensis TaxID=7602 RepID=UPI003AB11503